jgi:hypothetical protein
MKEKISAYATDIYKNLEPQMYKESIKKVLETNGKNKDAPRACKPSSSVYILYSTSDEVLYVGETGKSVKTRCAGDGSGSHNKKPWFSEVNYIKHFTKDKEIELPEKERKLLEQAFSIYLSPKYYGSNI